MIASSTASPPVATTALPEPLRAAVQGVLTRTPKRPKPPDPAEADHYQENVLDEIRKKSGSGPVL
jgi:hypothetical protein